MRWMAIVGCATALSVLAGCPGDSTAPTLASASSRYDAGQYELALTESEAVVTRGSAGDRDQAELIAGMAAFQLDRFDAAERHFLSAERSGAPAIRGRARVMLANIRLEQGRTADAAALFDSAAADLTGADAEKARRYAALARDGQLGSGQHVASRVATTASAVVQSPSSATPERSKAPVPRPPAATDAAADARAVFTVRAGAYTTEAAAKRRVKALAADVRRTKSPEPHVAPVKTKDGDTLYAVRIGTFRSRADAEALLRRLARKDLAVGAL